jgi:glycine betaine/choline ABC-type transport system substrate-binding protein
VLPEYTGTALMAILKLPAEREAPAVFAKVQNEYNSKWRLTWMRPFGFNNTFAMTVRGDLARSAHLESLSDAARRSKPWRLGVGYEFLQRSDGYDGLVRTYGLRVEGAPVTMDLGLLYQALSAGHVEMVAANATDGQLSRLDVKVLSDDRRYFPPYECAAIVRQAVVDTHPELRSALDKLSGRISDETMRKLNYLVEGQHRPVPDVAREFLQQITRP